MGSNQQSSLEEDNTVCSEARGMEQSKSRTHGEVWAICLFGGLSLIVSHWLKLGGGNASYGCAVLCLSQWPHRAELRCGVHLFSVKHLLFCILWLLILLLSLCFLLHCCLLSVTCYLNPQSLSLSLQSGAERGERLI